MHPTHTLIGAACIAAVLVIAFLYRAHRESRRIQSMADKDRAAKASRSATYGHIMHPHEPEAGCEYLGPKEYRPEYERMREIYRNKKN